jgi:hypothetical protein
MLELLRDGYADCASVMLGVVSEIEGVRCVCGGREAG